MAYAEVVVSSSQATSESLPISVFDLMPSRAGEPASSAIAQSVELARRVEQLAYKRYWVAEHHSIQGLVCSAATPILIGHIAAATKKIRVGSGGVMLPNHAPLVVAEQFGTLESMYPGRIDLGLGRAPGATFKPCARCEAVWLKTAKIFRPYLKSCAHTWDLKDLVNL
jgi:luciferase family oxidoreductase group 1